MDYKIRNVEITDAGRIAEIYRHYVENTAVTFELASPSDEEMADRIRHKTQHHPWIVIETGGVIAGYAYADRFRERIAYRFTTEVSVYLDSKTCGKGYGRILAVSLLDLLKRSGFYVAIAGITASNTGSIRFFESLGFEKCADYQNSGYKDGEWHSVVMLSKALQNDFIVPPDEIKTGLLRY